MAKNVRSYPGDFCTFQRERHFSEFDQLLSYVQFLRETPVSDPDEFLFRGLGNADFDLTPSAFREPGISELRFALSSENAHSIDFDHSKSGRIVAEKVVLAKFYRAADRQGIDLPLVPHNLHTELVGRPFTILSNFIVNSADWPSASVLPLLALAQHHGVPTRLLDWTKFFHIALYFAVRSALSIDPLPKRLAIAFCYVDYLRHVSTSFGSEEPTPYRINVITPPYGKNPNLHAQSGCFTLVSGGRGKDEDIDSTTNLDDAYFENYQHKKEIGASLVTILDRAPRLQPQKWTLPTSELGEISRYLLHMGADAASLFPGLDGCRQAMKDRYDIARALESIKS